MTLVELVKLVDALGAACIDLGELRCVGDHMQINAAAARVDAAYEAELEALRALVAERDRLAAQTL